MSLLIDEHRHYLQDTHRVGAFRRAIAQVVQPADVVLDLGSGTGLLGFLAASAGARRVYAIEQTGMIELAREAARENGFGDRIIFVKGFSTRVDLPEKVNVIVSDQMGRFGFEAGVVQYFNDARRRLLEPGGRTIPQSVEMFVAPVENPETWDQVDFWAQRPAGFAFSSMRSHAANTGYPVRLSPSQLLAREQKGSLLDFSAMTPRAFSFSCEFEVSREGTMHGIAGWFVAQLSPDVSMTNSPLHPQAIGRQQAFFPIDRPIAVFEGDRITLAMNVLPTDLLISWRVRVSSREGSPRGTFDHSTFRGMLIAQEDLSRTDHHCVPRLTEWGQARRSVLELCDGSRSLREIEQQFFARHPSLFSSDEQASEFIAEVITRYAE